MATRSVGPPQPVLVRRWVSVGSSAASAAAKTTRPPQPLPPPPPPGGGAGLGRRWGKPERRGLGAGGDRACADGGGREDADVNKARGRSIRHRPSGRPAPRRKPREVSRVPGCGVRKRKPEKAASVLQLLPRALWQVPEPRPGRYLQLLSGARRCVGACTSVRVGGAGSGGRIEGCPAEGLCPRLRALRTCGACPRAASAVSLPVSS